VITHESVSERNAQNLQCYVRDDLIFRIRHLSVNAISTDLDRFNGKLLVVTLSSSADLEPTFDAGMITYVSSTYLAEVRAL